MLMHYERVPNVLPISTSVIRNRGGSLWFWAKSSFLQADLKSGPGPLALWRPFLRLASLFLPPSTPVSALPRSHMWTIRFQEMLSMPIYYKVLVLLLHMPVQKDGMAILAIPTMVRLGSVSQRFAPCFGVDHEPKTLKVLGSFIYGSAPLTQDSFLKTERRLWHDSSNVHVVSLRRTLSKHEKFLFLTFTLLYYLYYLTSSAALGKAIMDDYHAWVCNVLKNFVFCLCLDWYKTVWRRE